MGTCSKGCKCRSCSGGNKAFRGGPSANKKTPPRYQEYTRGLKKYTEGGSITNLTTPNLKAKPVPSKNSSKKYEPSDAVKKTKAALAVASNLPQVGQYAAIASAVGDAYTAARYYADGNKPKAREDLIQAGLSLVKPFRGKAGIKGDTQLSDFAKNANKALKVSQASSDAKTVYEAKKEKKYTEGGKVKESFDQWKTKYNLKETPDYNLKRAWELGYTPDKNGHLPSIDSQTLTFLKKKGHGTIQKELDWYNSNKGAKFKKKYDLDTSGEYYKYVPIKKHKEGGKVATKSNPSLREKTQAKARMGGKSRTAKYYAANPEARKKKAEYDTKYHSTPERRKYRAELVQKNREMGKKGDGLDVSHQKGGKFILEKASKNRARK